MTIQQEKLHRFFTEKAKHLQNEIDLEIANIGGEDMLISREDLIHWVYHSRREIEMYHTICGCWKIRQRTPTPTSSGKSSGIRC